MLPQLFEIVPDALILVEGDGRVVQANANAERLFGYPSGGLAGLGVEVLMPAGVRGRHRQHRMDYMANPRVRPMGSSGQSLVGQRLDGGEFPVEIALSPVETTSGTRYLASIRDISESQRARQAMVRARYDGLIARIGQLALESAEQDHLIHMLPSLLAEELDIEVVAVAILTADHSAIEVPACFGIEAGAVESRAHEGWPEFRRALSVNEATIVGSMPPNAHGDFSAGVFIPLLDRDRPVGMLIAMSREARHFHHDAMHLLQSSAHLLAALMQRRRTEEQLAHSQRLDAIGQLTGGVAHDFNNLLTVISGSLQLLEIECRDRPEAKNLIAGALRSVCRGAELTAKLLTFARRQHLTPGGVVPQALLHELGMMLQRTLGDAIRLTIDCPDSVPAAYVDVAHLETALINLALNARDAMPQGGDITISAEERWVAVSEAQPDLSHGHYVVLRVEDTGSGMNAETAARAVEPFFTTKSPGRGSGLGLSMVYGFVRQSRGYLRIDSRLGHGTRVEIYLPVATATRAPLARAKTAVRGDGETVLVVEDEADVRQIAVAFLSSLGYRTIDARNAAQALDMLTAAPGISLLFSDVMLGSGINGGELADQARQLRPGLPVLLTSGYDETAGAMNEYASAGFEFLRKPYRREQLADAIERCLAR